MTTVDRDHGAPEPADRRWFLLQCKPREVFRAVEHLGNQGFTAFVPTLQREVMRRGRRDIAIEPLFPHYCFVRLSDLEDNWAPIRSTRGVTRLVRFGELPLAVPEHVVTALQAREAASQTGETAPEALFSPGQKVMISGGPLAGLEAVFSARDGDERVILLLKLLHQEHSVKVPLGHVRAGSP